MNTLCCNVECYRWAADQFLHGQPVAQVVQPLSSLAEYQIMLLMFVRIITALMTRWQSHTSVWVCVCVYIYVWIRTYDLKMIRKWPQKRRLFNCLNSTKERILAQILLKSSQNWLRDTELHRLVRNCPQRCSCAGEKPLSDTILILKLLPVWQTRFLSWLWINAVFKIIFLRLHKKKEKL